MTLHIITDSTSEISQAEAKRLDLYVVPLTVLFGDQEYTDGINLTPEEFYAKMRVASELPKTSQVSLATFIEVFNTVPEEDEILGIFLSSELSGTFQAAKLAADTLERKNLYLVDSRMVTFALGALVQIALRRRAEGWSAHAIAAELNILKTKLVIQAVIPDLKYLKMGGRLSNTAAAFGSVLRLRPIVEVIDGKVTVIHKTIGTHRAYEWMIQQMKKAEVDGSLPRYLGHSDAMDKLTQFQTMVQEETGMPFPTIFPIGITVGTHAGLGCVGLCYFKK